MSFMCRACHAQTACTFTHMSGSFGPCEDCRRAAMCVQCRAPKLQERIPMTSVSATLNDTPRICENCLKETQRRFTVECTRCEQDMNVCDDCVNANPAHEECPD